MQAKVDLVYFDAGGGHRAAALALRDMLQRQQRPWNVRLVHLAQVIDRDDRFRRITGMAPEDLYNRRLARGWTLGLAQELKLLQATIRALHAPLVRRLQAHWTATRPDLVVSLVPNFNRALGESVAAACPGVPFATVITDLADLPPRFWIEPGVEQHVVAGTPRAQQQALALGVPASRVSLVSGMLLRPAFYDPPTEDRVAARRVLGLPADAPVGVVMYGAQGSAEMLRIARRLPDTPLVLMTGRNLALAQRLRALPSRAPRVLVGFTPDVPRWMRLGDFFIGKPGPGALSEALHLGLPVLTFDNAWTMPQERFNTRWVRELGVGEVVRSVGDLPQAVGRLIERLPELRRRVAWLDNRAVFEVPEVLDVLLQASVPVRLRASTLAARAAAGLDLEEVQG